ncbi:taste receptor cell protein 1-like isoform X1 [Balaenoptera ricei]|uniref:taste receptor cell protein 1-like isoform X1 n=1 Tax=Balaenoptera ricei TaxID=2746895 RepID=UPI0028BF0978|nr:taste receptor cell protein 1-like isoform X1 [Balaenoptera ricei]XP_059768718.1 taste receptor cell protein 1-like isoform X1 [Balaenoptera ricei]XP_059768719.1 taste receptor cell protein 1-like isoform X1 [Balaenoptera ricei]XP_059768720.1 taste receptor cell protein 1-like isoform X1 [Balaenoptera ricei]
MPRLSPFSLACQTCAAPHQRGIQAECSICHLPPGPGGLAARAGAFGMSGQWLPAAGLLLAAVLVVSASALPLLPPHKDLGPSPLASGTSALQADSKKILLPSLNSLVTVLAGVFPSAKRPGEAPGRKAGALFPEAPGDQQALLGSLLDLPLHSDQPAPLGTTGVSSRATPRPAPSAVAEPAAHRAPESQPVSYVAGPGEEILVTGSPEIAATSPSQASPQPLAWPVGRHTFSPNAWVPCASGASNFRPGTAPLLTLAPKAPEKAVSSAPQGPLAFTSISNTLAATVPLLPVTTVWSGLDTASTALTVGSGSPRSGRHPVWAQRPVVLQCCHCPRRYPLHSRHQHHCHCRPHPHPRHLH